MIADFSVYPLLHASLFSFARVSKRLCVSPTYTLPLARDLVEHTCQLRRGSFILVRSERRVEPDLKTTFKLNFSQAFAHSHHLHMGSLLVAASPLGNPFPRRSFSAVDVVGLCKEEELARMNGKVRDNCSV